MQFISVSLLAFASLALASGTAVKPAAVTVPKKSEGTATAEYGNTWQLFSTRVDLPWSPQQRGPYEDLDVRKRRFMEMGGNLWDLALALYESPVLYPFISAKKDDKAAWGLFRQRWEVLRIASEFKGQAADKYRNGAALNKNIKRDIAALHATLAHLGPREWARQHLVATYGASPAPNVDQYLANIDSVHKWLLSDAAHATDGYYFS